jgi:hypothetical protein
MLNSYPKKVNTKYGVALVATVSEEEDGERVNVFLPSRFGEVFSDEEITSIEYKDLRLIVEGKKNRTYDVKLISV